MPSIGPAELVLVFIIALLVLGPKRLPEVGRQIGRAMREFRAATSTIRSEMGVDDIAKDVRDIRATAGVDDMKRDITRDVDGVKDAFRVDAAVKEADATAKAQAAGGADDTGALPAAGSAAPASASLDEAADGGAGEREDGDGSGTPASVETRLTSAAGALFAVPADDPTADDATSDDPVPTAPGDAGAAGGSRAD